MLYEQLGWFEVQSFRYIDGGTHSPTNADLLADRELDLIVIVAPMSVDSYSNGWMTTNGALRLLWRAQVQREVAELEAQGHTVLLLEPSIDEARSMGPTMMDPTRIVNVVLQTSSAARSAITDEKFSSQLAILRSAAKAST